MERLVPGDCALWLVGSGAEMVRGASAFVSAHRDANGDMLAQSGSPRRGFSPIAIVVADPDSFAARGASRGDGELPQSNVRAFSEENGGTGTFERALETLEALLRDQEAGAAVLAELPCVDAQSDRGMITARIAALTRTAVERSAVLVLAVYREQAPAALLLELLPFFSKTVFETEVYDNPYYSPPTAADLHERMLDQLLDTLRDRASAESRYSKVLESRNTLRMLSAIIDSMGDGLLVTDETGKMLLMNKTAESIIGYGFSDLPVDERVRKFGNYLPDKTTPYPLEDLPTYRALRGESSDQVEIFLRNEQRPEGIWCSTTARPLRAKDGTVQGGVLVFRDITHIKAAEEEKQKLLSRVSQTQKLESLGLLAGGIAHDFNNLLMGVLGNAGLALLESPLSSKVEERIKQIRIAAKRLADLTNQLLAYSGRGTFLERPVDISDVVGEIEQLLRTVVSKRAEIYCELEENLPIIMADETQLRQVVMNLITNASDALGSGTGAIRVRSGLFRASRSYLSECYLAEELPEGDYVFLEVEDTGCGMDERTQLRIFDPFFTTKLKGRGLGLAAVLGLVRRHGGALHVKSVLGAGTTFRVLFPPLDSEASKHARTELEATVRQPGARFGQGKTVLIVDDEEIVRNVAREMLEHSGFTVLVAESGTSGISIFQEHASFVDVVLLDMTMPDMQGDEVFQELKRVRPNIRVIISSGYSEGDTIRHFDEKGFAGYLQKPYVPEALTQTMERVLSRASK